MVDFLCIPNKPVCVMMQLVIFICAICSLINQNQCTLLIKWPYNVIEFIFTTDILIYLNNN